MHDVTPESQQLLEKADEASSRTRRYDVQGSWNYTLLNKIAIFKCD